MKHCSVPAFDPAPADSAARVRTASLRLYAKSSKKLFCTAVLRYPITSTPPDAAAVFRTAIAFTDERDYPAPSAAPGSGESLSPNGARTIVQSANGDQASRSGTAATISSAI